jgi:periplasmic divalent cation tolerance protein
MGLRSTGALQLHFTIDDAEAGAAIAGALVDERLAACVQQVGPITSRYRWEGRVEVAQEWLFVAKTTEDRVDAAIARVVELHPYETPEVLATPVVAGLGAYLEWNREQTAPPG